MNEGRFFPKQRLVYFKIHHFACSSDYFISKCFGSCFLVTDASAVIFVDHQNGKYLANSWSSVRRAEESAHTFYSVRFYIDVSTFELS